MVQRSRPILVRTIEKRTDFAHPSAKSRAIMEGKKGAEMPPERGQATVPLFLRRAAALAAIEAEQNLIARPIEFGRIFYFAMRTPGSSWATDQNGKLPQYLKGILHAATRSQFLKWLAASLGLLCADCGEHCYPNCITHPKKCSRRNRRKRYEQPASALADPQNPSRFTLALSDRLFVLDMYRPIFEKVRRKRKPRTKPSVTQGVWF
ncbi:MAG TPA: hypothetical protein VFI95_11345 [Terriglobales bacterium]|nr:hypothetical protein [Terriglobales bacterium]